MPTKAAIFSGCIIALLTLIANPIYAAQPEKNRLIVTTDIGGADPDDIQSMIHLLLLSDCVDIEGLISSPAWVPHPDHTSTIRDIIDKYDLAYDNLIVHSPQYPSAEYLKSIVVRGQSTPTWRAWVSARTHRVRNSLSGLLIKRMIHALCGSRHGEG